MEQKELNTFIRKYFDVLKKAAYKNCVVLSPTTGTEHKKLIVDICMWASSNNLTFFTEVPIKGDEVVDIVIPELSRPFIEIRHSELGKTKEYLTEYDDMRQFVDSNDYFKLR